MARHRGGDDDPTAATRAHVPRRGLHGREGAAQVDRDDLVPAALVDRGDPTLLRQRTRTGRDPGVGEHDVQAALAGGLGRHRLDRRRVGDVDDRGPDVTSRRSEPVRLPLHAVLVHVGERDPGAARAEHVRDGQADAAGCSGDQDAEPLDVEEAAQHLTLARGHAGMPCESCS
jgi:hypothetical protein